MRHNYVKKSQTVQNDTGNVDVIVSMKTRCNFIRLVDFLN